MPVLLHPDPRSALVIGLGGGATAGAVSRYPDMTVDVVELSSAVVAGARFFEHINFGLLDRPHVSLRVDDGRNYLLTTRTTYDVMTADIILPHHAGAGSLYSRDYFELVRSRLNPGGLVMQWNGGEDATYRLILRTFLSVFPNTTLWADGTLMVGSVEPFTFSRTQYDARRANPQFRGLFDWDYQTIVDMYLGGPPELARWVGDGPIITDDRPLIEYFLSLPKDAQRNDLGTLVGRVSDIVRP
jgi:spermidine synthase